MSTAVAIQKEAFCCFCESNYKEAIREMKVRSQSPRSACVTDASSPQPF